MEQTFQAQVAEIRRADVVVGLPSFNNARTIGHVVRAVTAGLTDAFPDVKAVLVNSDGGSTDGTPEEVRAVRNERVGVLLTSHPIHPVHRLAAPYHGMPGKENAFRTIFEATEALNARACVVVDPGLKSITPAWAENLLKPVYVEGFDYVAPLYARHKFDGTLTNAILYPLTRALYGKSVRQLIGGDFAFSGQLVKFCLTGGTWESDSARFGMDIWLATLALCERYKVCQSFLGPRIYEVRGPESDLGSMFAQVVASVYSLMEDYQACWKGIQSAEPVRAFGVGVEVGAEPLRINVERMINIFRLGVRELTDIWRRVLSPESIRSLESLARSSGETFALPLDLWVEVVYDFAVAYHQEAVHRDHLLKSMIPLYLGWVASFVKENQERSAEETEEQIEALCKVFEARKPYLIQHWVEKGGGRNE